MKAQIFTDKKVVHIRAGEGFRGTELGPWHDDLYVEGEDVRVISLDHSQPLAMRGVPARKIMVDPCDPRYANYPALNKPAQGEKWEIETHYYPPYILPLDHWLQIRSDGDGAKVTWQTLYAELEGEYLELFERIQQAIAEVAPEELLSEKGERWVDDPRLPTGKRKVYTRSWSDPARGDGGGRILTTSVLLSCWLLSQETFRQDLLGSIYGHSEVVYHFGLLGSVGAGTSLVIPEFLRSRGIKVAMMGHLSQMESCVVKGEVREHVVMRVFEMLSLSKGITIVTGPPPIKEPTDRIAILDELTPYLLSVASNADVLANRFDATAALLCQIYRNTNNLFARLIAHLVLESAEVTPERAKQVLNWAIEHGFLKYSPDANGRHELDLVYRNTNLEGLEALIPVLLYTARNDVSIQISEARRFGKSRQITLRLFGNGGIDRILFEKLGVSLDDLLKDSRGVRGLDGLDLFVLQTYRKTKISKVEALLADNNRWRELVKQFSAEIAGSELAFPLYVRELEGYDIPTIVAVSQPLVGVTEFVHMALSTMALPENIADPFGAIASARAHAKEQEHDQNADALRREQIARLAKQ